MALLLQGLQMVSCCDLSLLLIMPTDAQAPYKLRTNLLGRGAGDVSFATVARMLVVADVDAKPLQGKAARALFTPVRLKFNRLTQ